MTTRLTLAAFVGAVVLAACDKTAVRDITTPTVPSARIRFFNFGVNAPGVNFYANTNKISAINTSNCTPTPTDTMQARICRETGQESTTGIAYGGVSASGLYSAIEPGSYTIAGKIAAATDKDLTIATATTTIDAGKNYSYYMSGFYNTTTKTSDSFIVEDPLPPFVFESANVRFVNAISNSSPMTLIARDSTTKVETPIGGVVAYKSAGAYTALPSGLYELYTVVTGSSTKVIKREGVTFSTSRVYTISARGDITITSTTATNRPFLDNTLSR